MRRAGMYTGFSVFFYCTDVVLGREWKFC